MCGLRKDEQVTVLMHRLKEIEDVVDKESKVLNKEIKKLKQQRDRLHEKIEMINKILHDEKTLKRLREKDSVDETFFNETEGKDEEGEEEEEEKSSKNPSLKLSSK